MSAISAFNKILIEFAKNLETTFPEDSDFLVFRTGLETLVKYNCTSPGKLFQLYVTPMKDKDGNTIDIKQKILDNDSSFFLEKMDYTSKVTAHTDGNDTANAFQTIDKLKLYWNKLSSQGQATVMKYLIALVKLSDKI